MANTGANHWTDIYRMIEALEQGELQQRIDESGLQDEAASLAIRLNRLAAGLEKDRQHVSAKSNQEDEFKEKIIKEILDNLGHEIRTPMNSILGFSRLLLKEKLQEELHDYAFNIYDSAESLLVVINDLLDFARLEQGEFELENGHFSLREVLDTGRRLFSLKVEEKGLDLIFETSNDLPEALFGDRPRVLQLLTKLLDNAIKFTERGAIKVKTKVIHANEGSYRLHIEVQDTGIGIPEDMVHNIFSGFTQAKGTPDRKYGGTGIGLTICNHILSLMDGQISVESKEGKGSSFNLYFNLQEGQQNLVQERPVKPVGIDRLKGLKILLAEDNRNNQILACKVLEELEMEVKVANNGLEALDLIKFNNFDLILMDIQMPEMDGIEATTLIRDLPGPKSEIPIVAVTAHALRHEIRKYKRAGVDEYVPKPFQPDMLYSAIERCLWPGGVRKGQTPPLRTPGMDQLQITDLSNLKQLAAGDNGFLREMIEVFLEDVPDHLQKLRNALLALDWKHMKYMAHKLKGPAEMMGVRKAVSLLDQIEFFDETESTPGPSLLAIIDEVTMVCEEAVRELENEYTLLT